jgi:hypothetical protein
MDFFAALIAGPEIVFWRTAWRASLCAKLARWDGTIRVHAVQEKNTSAAAEARR